MAEYFNKDFRRIRFLKGNQTAFINKIGHKLKLKDKTLASLVGVHTRTFNGWRHEECLMSLYAAKTLSNIANIPVPKNITIKDRYWYTHLGANAGWQAVKQHYGRVPINEEYRQKKWYEWWEKKGRFMKNKVIGVRKTIKKPSLSVKLAEFTGIMMGDGGITERQIKVTLHAKDDLNYAKFIQNLIKQLFKVPVSTYSCPSYGSVINLVVSRTELVQFCVHKLGLPLGNKIQQGLDMPEWILANNKYKKSCLRGLVDTDGCVFHERHMIKGKEYSYPRLNFTSASADLCDSVFTIMQELGLSPRKRNKQGMYRCIQLESKDNLAHYFEVIGTHNPKHKRRYAAR